MLYGVSNVNP
jgi:hypothetical protein